MQPRHTITEIIFLLVILLVPIIYLAAIYPSLPAIVPTHFDIQGRPNSYNSKKALCYIVLLVSALGAGIYLLLKNLPSIDPKRRAKLSANIFVRIALAIAGFLSAINIVIIYSALHGTININSLFYPALAIFFAYLGNMMHSIKPNYFVGIRTPWALENEDNWRATHRLGSKVFFAGGILIAIASLLFSLRVANIIILITIGLMILVPVVYSFWYFKNHTPKPF
jgi:uncharacterized membrane protein